MSFFIHQEGRLLVVQWAGVLTRQDLGRIFQELPEWSRSLGFAPDVIHIFSEVESIDFVFEDLIEHSRGRIWTEMPNRVKSAAVGSSPLTQGYARMFRALNANPMIQMEVFETETDARRWLATPEKR